MEPHPSDLEAAPSRRGPKLTVLRPGDEARPLPHSIEAEEYLLSCMMLDREVVAKAQAHHLKPSAFYDTRHGIVFAAIEELYRAGHEVDVAFVAEKLKQQGKLDQIGSYSFLTQISSKVPTTARDTFFIRRVRDLCAQREMIRAFTEGTEKLYAMTGDSAEISAQLEVHQGHVARAMDYLRGSEGGQLEIAAQAHEKIQAMLDGREDTSRQLTTGLPDFDQHFGYLDANNEDWLVILGAFQNTGKTTFLRWVTLHNLLAGKTVMLFLIETGWTLFAQRMAAAAAGISANSLKTLPPDLRAAYNEKEAWINGLVGKQLIVFQDGVPLETMIARIDDHARRWGPPDLIGIDHIHRMNSVARKWHAREAEMGYIGKKLADVAKRHNRTILGLAQLNRSARSDGGNRRPQSHDLRDSGELEQAARRILLLHVPDVDCRGAEQGESQSTVELEVIQAKHNNGRMGVRKFWFRRDVGSYVPLSGSEYAAKQVTKADAPSRPKSKGEFRKSL